VNRTDTCIHELGLQLFYLCGMAEFVLKSLGKNFALKEGIDLQFRIDAYNIFNHPSFANPNTGESFAANSSGVLTPTSAASITSTENGARAFQLDARISF
jgi:hypothetical protein